MVSLFDTIVTLNKILGGERFQEYRENSLKHYLSTYQNKIDSNENLTPQDISDIAANIVICQYFNDRNHRTSLLFCYFYYLLNNRILKVKPYQLYAAIKFQEGCFFQSSNHGDNQILSVLTNSRYSICPLEQQIQQFEEIKQEVLNLHETLERLVPNRKPKEKQQHKMHNQQMKSFERFSKPLLGNESKMAKNKLPKAFLKSQKITPLFELVDDEIPSYVSTSSELASHVAPSPLTIKPDEVRANMDHSELVESSLNLELSLSSVAEEQHLSTVPCHMEVINSGGLENSSENHYHFDAFTEASEISPVLSPIHAVNSFKFFVQKKSDRSLVLTDVTNQYNNELNI